MVYLVYWFVALAYLSVQRECEVENRSLGSYQCLNHLKVFEEGHLLRIGLNTSHNEWGEKACINSRLLAYNIYRFGAIM